MREYLNTWISSVAQNVVELEKKTFYIGVVFALSLVHGGPSHKFLTPPVADYILYGNNYVHVSIKDIPTKEIKDKVIQVII